MLTGSYFNSIDHKGRVTIPVKLRYSLGERVYVSKGIDSCLYIFTLEAWQRFIEEYVSNRSLKDSKARQLQRFFSGGSQELTVDSMGRINLPQDLIGYAGIKKDVVLVGCIDRAELWSAEKYENMMSPENLDPDELMRDASGSETG